MSLYHYLFPYERAFYVSLILFGLFVGVGLRLLPNDGSISHIGTGSWTCQRIKVALDGVCDDGTTPTTIGVEVCTMPGDVYVTIPFFLCNALVNSPLAADIPLLIRIPKVATAITYEEGTAIVAWSAGAFVRESLVRIKPVKYVGLVITMGLHSNGSAIPPSSLYGPWRGFRLRPGKHYGSDGFEMYD